MKIHYFQRYHKGEDVATANTMLLLSRLYRYDSDKFFELLKNQFFSDVDFEPELSFVLQDKYEKSVPDATITQPSFKLVVETKLTDWFYKEQLIKHLSTFGNEQYKVLITLSSEYMNSQKKKLVDEAVSNYNKDHKTFILHVNTTFDELANGINDVLSGRDYEMKDILDDYFAYCENDNLIKKDIAYKTLRMHLAGKTFDFNVENNLYYDNVDHKFRAFDYLGLYKEKSVRAIGKVEAIITAVIENGDFRFEAEKGEFKSEYEDKIRKAAADAKNYGYELKAERFFFVEKFYETDFKKASKGAPMGVRVFDLEEVFNIKDIPDTEVLAEMLSNEAWN